MPKGLLAVSLVLLALAPSSTYTRALERTYLERRCVHACTQLCTGGYTIVYTRVYFCLLGSSYILGQYIARVQVFLSSV